MSINEHQCLACYAAHSAACAPQLAHAAAAAAAEPTCHEGPRNDVLQHVQLEGDGLQLVAAVCRVHLLVHAAYAGGEGWVRRAWEGGAAAVGRARALPSRTRTHAPCDGRLRAAARRDALCCGLRTHIAAPGVEVVSCVREAAKPDNLPFTPRAVHGLQDTLTLQRLYVEVVYARGQHGLGVELGGGRPQGGPHARILD